ncbi:DUF1992 domain-containing protein [Mesobacillus zeae]|uniref:DUF1992 domain-containing protein n=1 Tax=Mesobacillus zeae TaxID=1917180 RepID=A0A398BBZ5_9BACI|nr:DUF1992 domain-containing protein [Mesobacillus zeae]RID85163.1 DUF1992 domain-containing protein [Mesobacillus zeae]
MDFSLIIAEDRIKKAYDDGEFENLPGFGKPLKPDELASVPQELRMAYRIMKNAGYSPEENAIRQEILSIEDLIRSGVEGEEAKELQQKLNEKLVSYQNLVSNRGLQTNSSIFKNYHQKIEDKLL